VRLETTYLNERLQLFDGVYTEHQAATFRSVSHGYNRHLGPVLALNVHRPELTDLGLYSASCRTSPLAALMADAESRPLAGASPLVPAGGKGATLAQAVTGALGEAGERLLAILHYPHVLPELIFASFEELQSRGLRAVDPEHVALFAPEQYAAPGFPWRPFTPRSRVRWMRGAHMLSGDPVLAPAQLVLLWYERVPDEVPIGYPTTGGWPVFRRVASKWTWPRSCANGSVWKGACRVPSCKTSESFSTRWTDPCR
jgi:ribosomal protein S12 methylthiotransferase accessory factor